MQTEIFLCSITALHFLLKLNCIIVTLIWGVCVFWKLFFALCRFGGGGELPTPLVSQEIMHIQGCVTHDSSPNF